MMYVAILVAHIFAACVTIAIIGLALYSVARGKSEWYRRCAFALAYVAGFEIISGTLLAVVSPEVSPLYVGTHLLAYLVICLVVEAMLIVKMQKSASVSS